MEIDEAVARLVRRHWHILLICILLPIVGAFVYTSGTASTYTSTSRIQVKNDPPQSVDEAGGLVSLVDSQATSSDVVAKAVADSKTGRDPAAVLPKIKVLGFGVSNVVAISVTDADPQVAQALTKAISTKVEKDLNDAKTGGLTKQLDALREPLKNAQKEKTAADGLAISQPTNGAAQAKAANAGAALTELQNQQKALQQQLATVDTATIVQEAILPTKPDPTGSTQTIGLAAVLGIILGLLAAAIAEIASPSVPGARRVARLLGEPMLGDLRGKKANRADLGRKIRLAARQAKVDTIVLAAVQGRVPNEVVVAVQEAVIGAGRGKMPSVEVWNPPATPEDVSSTQNLPAIKEEAQNNGLAHERTGVSAALASWTAEGKGGVARQGGSTARGGGSEKISAKGAPDRSAAVGGHQPRLRVVAIDDLDPASEGKRAGLVVVAPSISKVAQVRAISDLLELSGWPLLGVLAD